jgi:hypothetical protein
MDVIGAYIYKPEPHLPLKSKYKCLAYNIGYS